MVSSTTALCRFGLFLLLACSVAPGCGGGSGSSRLPTAGNAQDAGVAASTGGSAWRSSDAATGAGGFGTGGLASGGGAGGSHGAGGALVVDASQDGGGRDVSDASLDRASDSPAQDMAAPDSAGPDSTGPDSTGPDSTMLDLDGAEADATGCVLPNAIGTNELPALSFGSYHTLSEITTYLSSVAAAVPSMAAYRVLGQSVQGRSIPYLVINATCQRTPPAILLVGTHHGDEWSSTEATLAHVDYLLRGDADVRALLQIYAFYVLPVLNPDGHDASPPTRENADGVDINRDYAYPERTEQGSFKEKETQLIKSLQDAVGFRAALTFHSGTTSVLWSWCYTATPTADNAHMSSLGAKTAQAMGFDTYSASYFDYPTQGEYIDYAYMKSNTLAFTVEVSLAKTPAASALPQIVATTWEGTLALVQGLQGTLTNHAPSAVPSRMIMHAPRRGQERLE